MSITYYKYVNPQQQFFRTPQPIPEASKKRLLTFSRYYNKPIKFRFNIYDPFFKLLNTFDSFDVEHGYKPDIHCNSLNVSDGFDQMGSFDIGFFDHENNLDERVDNGNWVEIQIGRDQSKMENIMFGKVTRFNTVRGRMDEKYHTLQGLGSQIVFKETSLDFVKLARITDISTGQVNQNDSNLFAFKVFDELVSGTDHLIDKSGGSILDRGRFTKTGINPRVNDFVGSINQLDTTAFDVAKHLAELSIAFFKIDPYRNIIFDYPNNRHSGRYLKQFDINDRQFDFEDDTSYFHGDWNFERVFELESGSANILYSNEGFLKENVSSSAIVNSYYSLWNRDLAQQCTASPDFKDIYLLVSKQGSGSPNLTNLHGHVMLDRDGLPTGTKVCDFDIPLAAVPNSDSPQPIAISDFVYNPTLVKEEALVWIVLYERGNSENNTVRWYHDNDYQSQGRFKSAVRPLVNGQYPNNNHNSNLGWFNLSSNTPMPNFAFSLVKADKVRIVAEDPLSIQKHGRVSTRFNVRWSDNLITTSKALHAALYYTSKDRMEFFNNEVFVPAEYYFPVGDIITIIDEHSKLTKRRSQTGQIYERGISFNANTSVVGTHFMNIALQGYHNPLIDIVNNFSATDTCEL